MLAPSPLPGRSFVSLIHAARAASRRNRCTGEEVPVARACHHYYLGAASREEPHVVLGKVVARQIQSLEARRRQLSNQRGCVPLALRLHGVEHRGAPLAARDAVGVESVPYRMQQRAAARQEGQQM